MKLFARPKCFTDAIASLIIIKYLLGLRVFEYPRGQLRLIISFIYLLFLYGLYYASLHMQEEYFSDVRMMKLEYALYKMLIYITAWSILVELLLGWWYTKTFKACHKKMFEIDETLRQLSLTINYDGIYYMTIGMMISCFIFSFIICILVLIDLHPRVGLFTSIYIMIAYAYGQFVNFIIVFEFYIFAKYLQMRFELLNRLLYESLDVASEKDIKLGFFEMQNYAKIIDVEQQKNVLAGTMLFTLHRPLQSRKNISVSEKQNLNKSHIQSHCPSQLKKQFQEKLGKTSQIYNSVMTEHWKHKHLLQTIKQVHLELCKVSKTICTILGIQIALEIGVSIIFLTGAFYYLYNRYIIQRYNIVDRVTIKVIVIIILGFLYILKLFFLTRVCKKAAEEGNRIIEIIHGIYGCSTDVVVRDEVQQFGTQILQSPVSFSAFGLSLDNRILSMGLRTITTYVIVTIQVSISLESNKAIQYAQF